MLRVPCPVGEKKESRKTPRFGAEHLEERCCLLKERRGRGETDIGHSLPVQLLS